MKSFAALVLVIVTVSTAWGAGIEEWYVYPFIESFTWKEVKSDGRRLLKETGPVLGAGTQLSADLYQDTLILKGKLELFGGQTDYDGLSQQNDQRPEVSEIAVDTSVTYFGSRLESDLKWRSRWERGTVEPFAGVGYRWWLRDLHDSTNSDRNGDAVLIGGYTEYWQSIYGRLGVGATYAIGADWRLFAEGGGRYPFYTKNSLEYEGAGSVNVRPRNAWSTFGEAGARYKQLRASIYYEGLRFSQSSLVPAGRVFIYQPASEADILGLTIGWCFR